MLFISSSMCCSKECECGQDESFGCHFQVHWKINPHMKIGAVQKKIARLQHHRFMKALRKAGASVRTLPFIHGAYDSVFTKDIAVLRKDAFGLSAFLSRPRFKMRRQETSLREKVFKEMKIEIEDRAESGFEGGDLVYSSEAELGFFGYGFRSSPRVTSQLEKFLSAEIIPLELKDPYFYHLDTALSLTESPSKSGQVIAFACKEAFTEKSWQRLVQNPKVRQVIEVDQEEAVRFGLNWVEVDGCVILGSSTPKIAKALNKLGKTTRITPLNQFQLAGGSAACLVARVHDVSRKTKSEHNQKEERDNGLTIKYGCRSKSG